MKRIKLLKPNNAWGRYVITSICALMFGAIWVHAQITVTGTITGSVNGKPLPGANIVLKGTTTGTITDVNGKFELAVPNKNSVITISSLGYLSEEIVIGERTTINIALVEDITDLDEVLVIGYGSVRKKEVTGAVARVTSEELTKTVTHDLGSALQGHVAGVQITNSGKPGENADILIRGITTIGNDNSPLFVVDGVPYDYNPGVSPSEVESIDILKDAASCAIYGTRGAAGVILITTKQGQAGTLKVSVNGTYGVKNITSHTPLMDAHEDTYFRLVQSRNMTNSVDELASLQIQRWPEGFQYDTDIRNTVFIDNATTQDYNLTVSGGKDDITYNITAGYFNEDGVIINSHYNKFNTRANTSYKSGRWKIDASIGFITDDKDEAPGGVITQTIKYLPTQMDFRDVDVNETVETPSGAFGNNTNWVIRSIRNTDNTTSNAALGNFNINVDIYDGLSASTRFGLNNKYTYRKMFGPYQNVVSTFGDNIAPEEDSFVENIATRRDNLTWDAILKYQKTFGNHGVTAQAILTYEDMSYESFYARGEGIIDNRVQVLDGTSINQEIRSTSQWGGDIDWDHRRLGTLGRILYNYKSRYMLNISGRFDKSAKFAEDYRWGFFPSVSAAWNISDEPFWAPIKFIAQDTKIRISRGTTGNESFDPYQYSPVILPGYNYAYGPDASDEFAIGVTQTGFANPYVKWETSVMWNAGIDMAFLDNRVTFTAEVYDTRKEDMLFPILTPPSASGDDDKITWLNFGNMTNKGYELALGYRSYDHEFKWGINTTYASNKNEVTKTLFDEGYVLLTGNALISGSDATSRVTALAKGYEVASFFVYTTDGIIDTYEKLAAYQKINPSARMGDLIYKDNNDDGQINDEDREYVGSGLPDFTAGLNMNASYKGFDLTLNWYAAVGHKIMNGSKATAYAWERHKDLVYQWSAANPVTPIPAHRADPKVHPNYVGHTDLWVEDGSFLRLKTATLGYSLPSGIIQKLNLGNLRVFLSAQNPITITKYEGYDPEVGGNTANRGLDKGNYPITSYYLVGLNLNF